MKKAFNFKKELSFEEEYNLNTRPLEIDLLVIKKEPSVQIKNEIGHFFRSYNLLEYKHHIQFVP